MGPATQIAHYRIVAKLGEGFAYDANWSRDGKNVVFTNTLPKSGNDIWVLPNPMGNAAARKPYGFVQSDAYEFAGSISSDGKYLAYSSDENRTMQVYVQSFPGEGKFQISTNGGTRSVWRRDGKEIFYIDVAGKLMVVDVKAGARFEHGLPKPLFDVHIINSARVDVSPDGKRLLIPTTGGELATTSLMVVLNWYAGLKR